MTKKEKIAQRAIEILTVGLEDQKRLVRKALDSGAIDIEKWDENSNPMLLPKAIVQAVLEHEADQYSARGTSFEKSQKKEVKNIKLFL